MLLDGKSHEHLIEFRISRFQNVVPQRIIQPMRIYLVQIRMARTK